ncbi:MAG: ATP-binding protein [Fibrobacteres bacterium]|nr:ATP-binding protein [Fibrobacterota bacterium]
MSIHNTFETLNPRPDYINRVLPFIDKPVIKVITGMRRSGKSSFLHLIRKHLQSKHKVPDKNILYVDKESLEFDAIRNYSDLNKLVLDKFKKCSGKCVVLIDEIQEIHDWEKAVASFLKNKIADIYITGSNARLLASELATLLSGRYVEFPIYPLTFSEFRTFRQKATGRTDTIEYDFSIFMKYGGLPGLHHFELTGNTIEQYLNSVINTILFKDIIQRHSIREPSQLENITRFMMDNCGNITSARRISDYLKSQKFSFAPDRVQAYLGYLEQAFLIKKVRRYDLKGLRHLESLDKYYLGDIGLRHGLIGYRDSGISGVLENIVYLELLSRGYSISIGKQDTFEIDFIASKQNERLYIQVAYLLAAEKTIEREFRSLEMIKDNYPKIVLSMDTLQPEDRKGIKWMNILSFLTEKPVFQS